MKRAHILQEIAKAIGGSLVVVNHAGVAKEWYTITSSERDIPVQMGLAAPVALGLSLALPKETVIAIEGDGSLLHSIGILASIGGMKPRNLTVVVLENRCYEVVHNYLPTANAKAVNLVELSKSCGITNSYRAENMDEFQRIFSKAMKGPGPTFICAASDRGPYIEPFGKIIDPVEKKYRFVRHVEQLTRKPILSPDLYRSLKRRNS